jgi:hypothetical protein
MAQPQAAVDEGTVSSANLQSYWSAESTLCEKFSFTFVVPASLAQGVYSFCSLDNLCQYLLANFLRIQGQVHLASFEK